MPHLHYSYSVEVTSVLQTIFAAATIKKLSKTSTYKPHSVLLYVANDNVNEQTINTSLSNFKKLNFINEEALEFHDMRIKKINFSCDIAIVRTRLNTIDYNQWSYSRNFFNEVGNCQLLKIILRDLKCNQLIGVDDGLSNWRIVERNKNFIYSNICKVLRGDTRLKFFMKDFDKKEGVSSFSIFGKNKFNILNEFKYLVDELSFLHPKNRVVENLFLVTWPSINRSSTTGHSSGNSTSSIWKTQIEILIKYLDKISWNPSDKIYFKKHPKVKISESISNKKYKFEYLPFDDGSPAELMISLMNNLKVIFSFQNTTAYLLKSNVIDCSAQLEIIRSEKPGFFNEHSKTFDKI